MASHIDYDKQKQTYRLRIPVPPEAQAALRTKNLIRGLGSDKAKAAEKADELRPKLNEMIRLAVAGEYPPLSDEACEELAYRWRGWVLREQDGEPGFEPAFETIRQFEASFNRYLALNHPEVRLGGNHAAKLRGWCLGECQIGEPQRAVAARRPSAAFPVAVVVAAAAGRRITFNELFEDWKAERAPRPKTADDFKTKMDRFIAHLKHDEAIRVTKADFADWKTSMLKAKMPGKSVENHLLPLKALFNLAERNDKITVNPTRGVVFSAKKDPRTKRLPFSDADARAILIAARKEAGVLRWIPWLMAFGGERLEELAGAAACDVERIEGVWGIRIGLDNRDANASLKNDGSIRVVPLHPAVVKEGFLQYVEKLPKDGPLFPDVNPSKKYKKRGDNASKRLVYWVRHTVGILEKRKAPSHSWRHYFKTVCRRAGIEEEIHDAITGHTNEREGRNYGEVDVHTLLAAVKRIKSPV